MMTNHPWKFHAIRSRSFGPFCDLELDHWSHRSQNLIDWSLDDDKSSLKISCNSVQKFLTFLWPWAWPLIWSLTKSNRLALGWWQIIPENVMQFDPVVFGEKLLTHTYKPLCRVHTFANATFVTISEDRELKSEHFGIGFIWIWRKLSALWQKWVFDLFVTWTLTFDLITPKI